jgi:hypothetical protein
MINNYMFARPRDRLKLQPELPKRRKNSSSCRDIRSGGDLAELRRPKTSGVFVWRVFQANHEGSGDSGLVDYIPIQNRSAQVFC